MAKSGQNLGRLKQVLSYCSYDWANSALATVIFTFVYSVYFSRGIVGNETEGASLWAYATGIGGFLVAVSAPFIGARVDRAARKKTALFILTVITALLCGLLAFFPPENSSVFPVLLTLVILTWSFEAGQAIYNSLMNDFPDPSMTGRLSGWSWAAGYFGGLFCLIIALIGFIGLGDMAGLFGIPADDSWNVRSTTFLVAVWLILFSIPLFLFYNTRPIEDKARDTYVSPIKDILNFVAHMTKTPGIIRFLIGSLFYRDGLVTLFAVGGIYASGTFGMSFTEILIFAIGLNITAGLGAFGFSFMDDKIGARNVIITSLIGLILCGLALILVTDKTVFLVLALGLGIFIGPLQASSRSLFSRLLPYENSASGFGFYALTGKSVSFLGPLIFGLTVDITDSQRAGIFTIILFWIIGLYFIMTMTRSKNT